MKDKKTLFWKILIGCTCAIVVVASGSTAVANIKKAFKKDDVKQDDVNKDEQQAEQSAYIIDDAAVL